MTDEAESRLVRERRQKLEELRRQGEEAYPWEVPDRVPVAEVLSAIHALSPGARDPRSPFVVAGRVHSIRTHGRTSFFDLDDASGSLQLLLRVDELGEEPYRTNLARFDPGDLVSARGEAMVSRRGEPSLLVRELRLLAKALRPPPEKYHGLQDTEERLRRRYVDLLSTPEVRARFRARSLLVRAIREFLHREGFLEFETPTLLPVAGGAAAEPFVTRSHYLDEELQLRIALELPLKRLLVGGFDKVYEIGHCFRNEDLDSVHSPEFTMLELYWAYADYRDMRGLAERLYSELAERVGELLPDVPAARDAREFFRPPFAAIDFVEELERRSGITNLLGKSREELAGLARAAGATVPDESPPGKFLDKLFEHYVEPTLDRPTFVLDHPESTTPLAKRHRTRAHRVERFEFFARGYELGNAYTELNDPEEQGRRFREQLAARGEDRYAYDADFVEALEYGMPPATGFGLGVDRLVMAMLGIPSIKEAILFPMIRRRA